MSNNDLISRSEAKKLGATCLARRNKNGQLEAIISLDNAPTVPLPDFKEGYKQAIIDGKTNFQRPQGEWNYIQAGMCVCPFCGATPHKDYKSFCPNCGAEMRGEEE